MRLLLFVFFCLTALVSFTRADVAVPAIHARVTDLTGTLSDEATGRLERKLRDYERETSNQIIVLMIPALEGGSIEDYTMQVAERNKVGKKGRDNGVLLVIARDDRKMRIEVGYGLEGVITDALSDQIIRRVIAPKFRSQDFEGGIESGIDAIMEAARGEFKGESPRQGQRGLPIPAVVILFILFGAFARLFHRGRRVLMGPGGFVTRGPWWFGGGGFGGGGFGGGGFGGGGGFSGGGGSFGGGGASGSW